MSRPAARQDGLLLEAADDRAGATRSLPGAGRWRMRTLAELREALRTTGVSQDLQDFEKELAGADLDDLTQVRELTQAYRHRVLMRHDPQAIAVLARTRDDVEDELRRKMAEARAR